MGFSAQAYAPPPVTGAPYSAQQVLEHTQTLADGTHITQSPRTTQFYRDAAGRTRTERPMGPPDASVTVVEITDPVAGCRYVLDPANQVAHRTALTTPHAFANRSDAFTGKIAPIAPVPPPPQPNPAVVSPSANISFSAAGPSPRTRPQMTHESLGSQVMQGLEVVGSRTTTVIPVGQQGNDQPMTTVHETWQSPQLHTAILTKTSDPRSGVSTVHLENLVVGDPDPALFVPPPSYQVVDETGSFQIHFTGTRQ